MTKRCNCKSIKGFGKLHTMQCTFKGFKSTVKKNKKGEMQIVSFKKKPMYVRMKKPGKKWIELEEGRDYILNGKVLKLLK